METFITIIWILTGILGALLFLKEARDDFGYLSLPDFLVAFSLIFGGLISLIIALCFQYDDIKFFKKK